MVEVEWSTKKMPKLVNNPLRFNNEPPFERGGFYAASKKAIQNHSLPGFVEYHASLLH
jgi:hypothetical protein